MEEFFYVRHTANAGVLIRTKAAAAGVDLFSRDPFGLYEDTPPQIQRELLEEIEGGRIDALLFTHGHGDHFCQEAVVEAFKRNPALTVIATEEVVGRLADAAPWARNLHAVSRQEGKNRVVQTPGFRWELFNSRHMGRQYAKVQNLVLMLELAGRRIVILGDAAPDPELFARIGRWSRDVDLMIAPFPLFGIPTNRKMIVESLRIREALAVHLPRPEADEQNWIASAKAVCAKAQDGLPAPEFTGKPGREYRMPGFL